MAGTHQRLIKGPGPQNGQNTNGTNNLCRDAAWVFWRKQQRLKLQWCGYMIKNGLECIENIFWRRIYEPTTGRECRKHPQNHKNHLKNGNPQSHRRLKARTLRILDPSQRLLWPVARWGEACRFLRRSWIHGWNVVVTHYVSLGDTWYKKSGKVILG